MKFFKSAMYIFTFEYPVDWFVNKKPPFAKKNLQVDWFIKRYAHLFTFDSSIRRQVKKYRVDSDNVNWGFDYGLLLCKDLWLKMGVLIVFVLSFVVVLGS